MSRRRKILIVAGIVLGVSILIPVVRHYQLRFAVANYIAELKAKGEPMELAQVIPPPVPPEQNGVPFITNAFITLKLESIAVNNTPPAMRGVAVGKAMVGWQQLIINDYGLTNSWEDLGRELAAAKNDLDSFQNLTNHPILDFNLNYDGGFDLLLTSLAPLKRSAQWLGSSALYNLREGNTTAACANAREILSIVNGEADERTLISQLVRIAIASIDISVSWEILESTNVSDDDLLQLQQAWQSPEFVNSLKNALILERCENSREAERTRKSSKKFNKLWGYFYYDPETSVEENAMPRSMLTERSLFLRKWDEICWRWFWSYEDELHGLRQYQAVIDATRMFKTNNSFQAIKDSLGKNLAKLNDEYEFPDGLREAFSANSADASLRKTVKIEAAQNILISAIALKRYQLIHGNFPADLNSLVPEFLSSVPLDPVDGKPLRYKLNSDGTFMLYSVGENGMDDGGNPMLEKNVTSSNYYWQNDHALDWVWPQPATEEEIQAYYKKLSSKSN